MIISVHQLPVLSLKLSMPLVGPWVAQAETTQPDDPTGATVVSDGTTRLMGTSVTIGRSGSRWRYSIVGGRGHLPQTLQPRSYKETSVREVAESVGKLAGETIEAAPTTAIPYWTHSECTTSQALTQLAERHELSWRVFDNGNVWIGTETWPVYTGEVLVLDTDPILGLFEIATESFDLRPGMALDVEGTSQHVNRVEYMVTDKLRVHVYATPAFPQG